jgi:CRISPR-associated exonuclease Cas4
MLIAFGFIFLLIAGLLYWLGLRRRARAGLPGGRVVYSDARDWGPVEKPLYDPDLGLTGKPDYLVDRDGEIIPVEVKTGRTPDAPYDTHLFQLYAYCRLVETAYGRRPSHGLLHYPGRTFAVDYTPAAESALLATLDEMRAFERKKNVDRSHTSPPRCKACGYRSICDQKL